MTKLFISRLIVAITAIFALSTPILTTSAVAQQIIVVDSAEILSKSKVGQHIDRQLKSIQSQMSSELKTMGSPIETEAKSLAAQVKGMTRETLQGRPDLAKRMAENQNKMAKFQYEGQIKEREILITRNKAFKAVGVKVESILKAIASEKGADVIMDRSTMIYMNPSIDMTQTVISRLNSQMPITPVNRERLPRK